MSWAVACTTGQSAHNPPETPPPGPPPATTPPPTDTAPPTTPAPTPAKPPLAELQKKNMETWRAGWEAHDGKKVASVYTADAVMAMPGPTGWMETTGRDAIEKQMSMLFTGFPDAKSGAERGFQINDVIVAQWVFNGTHSGEYMEMKPTNKKVGYHGISILWFNDEGLVKREHVYFDHGTIMAQLGLGPKEMKGRPFAELPPKDARVEWVNATNSAVEKKNLEIYRNFASVFEKKDEKAFLDMLADDATHTDWTQPADVKGKDGAKKEWAMMMKAFPDAKMMPKQAWAAGDYVIAESEMTGTFKGAMGPIKPTNKTGTVHGVDVILIKDGKVKSGWTYASSAEFAHAYGLAKPKAPPGVKATGPQVPATKPAPGTAPKPVSGTKPATPATPATPAKPGVAPAKPATPAAPAAPGSKPTPPSAPPPGAPKAPSGPTPAKPPMTK